MSIFTRSEDDTKVGDAKKDDKETEVKDTPKSEETKAA